MVHHYRFHDLDLDSGNQQELFPKSAPSIILKIDIDQILNLPLQPRVKKKSFSELDRYLQSSENTQTRSLPSISKEVLS